MRKCVGEKMRQPELRDSLLGKPASAVAGYPISESGAARLFHSFRNQICFPFSFYRLAVAPPGSPLPQCYFQIGKRPCASPAATRLFMLASMRCIALVSNSQSH